MRHLNPLEPGVMFWAERDTLEEIQALGVRCGQMGIPGSMKLTKSAAEAWKSGLEVVTMFAAYEGEDYADIPAVQRTVGFVPAETRESRERRTYEVSDFGARLGIGSIACHIGFVPEDPADPDYAGLRAPARAGTPRLRPCRRPRPDLRAGNRTGAGRGFATFHCGRGSA